MKPDKRAIDYRQGLIYRFQNISNIDAARLLKADLTKFTSTLNNFRLAVQNKHTRDELERMFREAFGESQADEVTNPIEQRDSPEQELEHVAEAAEISAPEPETHPGVSAPAKSSAVPAPPTTRLVYATQKPAVQTSESRAERRTEAYSDVVVSLAKTFEFDEQDTYFLSILLDEDIEAQSKISHAHKTRIVKIIRDAVTEKFTSLINRDLNLTQGEKVALNNILGIVYRNNKPDFQPGQTVSEYIHKNGSGSVDYDRQRFSADGLEKLATAFAKPAKASSLYN